MVCQFLLDHLSSESRDCGADSWEGVGGTVPPRGPWITMGPEGLLRSEGPGLAACFLPACGSLPWGPPGGQQCPAGLGTEGRSCFPASAPALSRCPGSRCPLQGGLLTMWGDGLPVVLEGCQETECCGLGVA